MPKKKQAVEDFNDKVELLQRYRRVFDHELTRSTVSAAERARMQRDIELFSGIHEDLLRLSGAPAPTECYDRAATAEKRDAILKYIKDSPMHVPIDELCSAFDMTADRIRNLMRPLRRNGVVVYDGVAGYRVLLQMPADLTETPRRLS